MYYYDENENLVFDKFQAMMDMETLYNVYAQEGLTQDFTLQQYQGREMGKLFARQNQSRKEMVYKQKEEERIAKVTAALEYRDQYYKEQRRLYEENRDTRMLKELEDWGLQEQRRNQIERNRKEAMLRLKLKREAVQLGSC